MADDLNYFEDGDDVDADPVRGNFDFILANMLQLVFDGVTTTSQVNLKHSTFTSSSEVKSMGVSGGSYKTFTYFMDVVATSHTMTDSSPVFVTEISTGNFRVGSITADYEVARAEVLEYLFRPSTLSDATTARIINNVTSITALKTCDSADVGMKSHWAYVNSDVNETTVKTGTFAGMSAGDIVSSWSYMVNAGNTSNNDWEIPEGTIKHTFTSSGNEDEFGTDTSADEVDNPTDCQMYMNGSSGTSPDQAVLLFCPGTVSWVTTIDTPATDYDYDFTADGSIPVTTQADTLAATTAYVVTPSTTVTTNETAVIMDRLSTIGSGATETIEVSFNGGTNWLTVTSNLKELVKITNTGTSFLIKFSYADLTNQSSVEEYAAYYG